MVSQNEPFIILPDAWNADSRDILPMDDDEARKTVETIIAKVLSNRRPTYSVPGGLYDAMKDAGGEVLTATNDELIEAGKLFEKLEGNDIHPAAAVATATLIKAVNDGKVEKDALIMLNITGGGEEKFKRENELIYLKPNHVFEINPKMEYVKEILNQLFK